MLVEVFILLLIILLQDKNIINKIKNVNLEYNWIIILSFILLLASLLMRLEGNLYLYLNLLSYIVLIVGIYLNKDKYGFRFIVIGLILNFIAMFSNSVRMPVSKKGLIKAGLYKELEILSENLISTHQLMNNETKFKILGDIIATPDFYIFPKVVSIGDVFIFIGLVIFLIKLKKE